jgi:hypothetical protein
LVISVKSHCKYLYAICILRGSLIIAYLIIVGISIMFERHFPSSSRICLLISFADFLLGLLSYWFVNAHYKRNCHYDKNLKFVFHFLLMIHFFPYRFFFLNTDEVVSFFFSFFSGSGALPVSQVEKSYLFEVLLWYF